MQSTFKIKTNRPDEFLEAFEKRFEKYERLDVVDDMEQYKANVRIPVHLSRNKWEVVMLFPVKLWIRQSGKIISIQYKAGLTNIFIFALILFTSVAGLGFLVQNYWMGIIIGAISSLFTYFSLYSQVKKGFKKFERLIARSTLSQ
ncbi:MAG: hypothetical protein MI810_19190 [Flavobacteriales bacterium]|nr:hypothetical protein [Flavobacteriales bacterium]